MVSAFADVTAAPTTVLATGDVQEKGPSSPTWRACGRGGWGGNIAVCSSHSQFGPTWIFPLTPFRSTSPCGWLSNRPARVVVTTVVRIGATFSAPRRSRCAQTSGGRHGSPTSLPPPTRAWMPLPRWRWWRRWRQQQRQRSPSPPLVTTAVAVAGGLDWCGRRRARGPPVDHTEERVSGTNGHLVTLAATCAERGASEEGRGGLSRDRQTEPVNGSDAQPNSWNRSSPKTHEKLKRCSKKRSAELKLFIFQSAPTRGVACAVAAVSRPSACRPCRLGRHLWPLTPRTCGALHGLAVVTTVFPPWRGVTSVLSFFCFFFFLSLQRPPPLAHPRPRHAARLRHGAGQGGSTQRRWRQDDPIHQLPYAVDARRWADANW